MRHMLKDFESYKTAYIQTFEGHFINESAFNLFFGLKNLGLKINLFEEEDLEKLSLPSPHASVVVGSVNVMHLILNMAGVDIPKPLDIPEELEEFTGRKIIKTTLRGLIDNNEFPIFVKPADRGKLFTGNVSPSKEDLSLYQHYDERGLDLPVIGSEVVSFKSEYRCFVHKNDLIDIRKYKGDPTIFPDVDIIKNAIEKYKHKAPVSYVFDFGVIDERIPHKGAFRIEDKTVLVEANDFYATGTYGLDPFNHAVMFLSRWNQLIKE